MEKESIIKVIGFKENSNIIDFKGNHNLRTLLGACLLWLDSYDAKKHHHDNFTFINTITDKEYNLQPANGNQNKEDTKVIDKLFFKLINALANYQLVFNITKQQILPILRSLDLLNNTMRGIYGEQKYLKTDTHQYIRNLINGMVGMRQENHI